MLGFLTLLWGIGALRLRTLPVPHVSLTRMAAGLSPPGGETMLDESHSSSSSRSTSSIGRDRLSNSSFLPAVLNYCLYTTCNTITNLFPLWVLGATIFGYYRPEVIKSYMHLVSPALALTMGFMGMTLTGNDFLRVLKEPRYILLGMASQFTIMPLLAATMAKTQQLPPELSAGLILVGCAPGGTASNLVTLIAKADVALSVTMTALSTMAASFMTPLMTSRLASQYVTVNQMELVKATVNVVLAPVTGGLLINKLQPKLSERLSGFTPSLSVLLVAFICGTISAMNAATLPANAVTLINSGFSLKVNNIYTQNNRFKPILILFNQSYFIG